MTALLPDVAASVDEAAAVRKAGVVATCEAKPVPPGTIHVVAGWRGYWSVVPSASSTGRAIHDTLSHTQQSAEAAVENRWREVKIYVLELGVEP